MMATLPALLPPQGSNYIPWQETWICGFAAGMMMMMMMMMMIIIIIMANILQWIGTENITSAT